MLIMGHFWRQSVLICLILLQVYEARSQCKQSYVWASWRNFTGRQATGTIVLDKKTVGVTMTANYDFSSENSIYRLDRFSGYSGYADIPTATVPATEWSNAAGTTTTMCFSEPVTNPVLIYSSLGRANPNDYQKVTLKFSEPYALVYDAGGTTFIDTYSLSGLEGNAIISFPGTFSCLTIYSEGTEFNTSLNWALLPPPFSVSITDTKECDKVTLTAQGGTTYKWSGGDNPANAINTVRTSGVYSVTATDQKSACSSTASTSVTVSQSPTIKADEALCLESAAVTLNSGATEPNLTYRWQPTNSTDPTLVVTQPGNYRVTVTSPAGCQASRNLDVRSSGFCGATIFAPDLFTPNGDQVNDLFTITVVDGLPIRLTIYDRWGSVMYSEENSNPRWDGTYKGANCLAEVYPYVLTYKALGGNETFQYKNKLTLVR